MKTYCSQPSPMLRGLTYSRGRGRSINTSEFCFSSKAGKGCLWAPGGSVTSCYRIIPRVKLGLGKMCKGRKNPRGLMDQFTNTVQYSTVISGLNHFGIIHDRRNYCKYATQNAETERQKNVQ